MSGLFCTIYRRPLYEKRRLLVGSTFSTLLSTTLCYHTNAVNASPKVRTQQDIEPCYNNSVESWRCESTASTAALDDAHDFLRAQQRSAIRAERSLVFYLPRHAAFKLLSRVRREPRPKPQALSLPSKRCITASWRQQGRESSGKMVKAGKRRAKRYSLRPPPARGEEGATFFRMRGKKNQALRYVLEPKRHKNGAKWQEAPTENGGQVAECRPAPGRPGGTTATTAEPKVEAASP